MSPFAFQFFVSQSGSDSNIASYAKMSSLLKLVTSSVCCASFESFVASSIELNFYGGSNYLDDSLSQSISSKKGSLLN